jgi:hypothetical protein
MWQKPRRTPAQVKPKTNPMNQRHKSNFMDRSKQSLPSIPNAPEGRHVYSKHAALEFSSPSGAQSVPRLRIITSRWDLEDIQKPTPINRTSLRDLSRATTTTETVAMLQLDQESQTWTVQS